MRRVFLHVACFIIINFIGWYGWSLATDPYLKFLDVLLFGVIDIAAICIAEAEYDQPKI